MKTVSSLSRLMPNIGGPKQRKRQLLMSVAQSQLLYAAPVWALALDRGKHVKTILGPQRNMAIRIACAYRTVSTNAVLVVAGMLSINLHAVERPRNVQGKTGRPMPNSSRQELRTDSIREWQRVWEVSETGSWTKRLISETKPWVTRTFGMVNYHLTQFLTVHGCFGAYLHRFKKLDDPRCHDCQAAIDYAEHAFFLSAIDGGENEEILKLKSVRT